MDATPHILFLCLIWKYCYLYEASPECNKALTGHHLKPIQLSVKIKERMLNVSWGCDFHREINMEYDIYVKYDEEYDYETTIRKCNQEIALKTHRVVCIKVIPTIKNEECQNLSSEKCIHLEINRTSAENVSCHVFNTSSMTCTWLFGKHAPDGTSYILSLRQKDRSIQCEQYERTIHSKTGACTFHNLSVDFFEEVTLALEGSTPGIQMYEEQMKLSDIEIFNPPGDISVTFFKDSVTIYWLSPQTKYTAEDDCFEYIIQKDFKEVYLPTSNPYTIPHVEKECSIRMKAKGTHHCGMNRHWGKWSDWISCDPLVAASYQERALPVELVVSILVSALILILLMIITLQYRRIVHTCFPQIPQPKNYLGSTEDCKIHLENHDHFSPMLQKSETEECMVVDENVT